MMTEDILEILENLLSHERLELFEALGVDDQSELRLKVCSNPHGVLVAIGTINSDAIPGFDNES